MHNFNNNILISKDRLNLYLSFKVKSSRIGRLILLILSTLMMLFSIFLMFFLSDLKLDFKAFLMFCCLLGINYLLIKYYLWNKYGEERLVISKRAVSFTYYFGFFETRIESFQYNELELLFEEIKRDKNNNRLGKLIFYSQNEKTGILELLHPTSVMLNEEVCRAIIEEVYIFLDYKDNHQNYDYNFDGFSFN